MKQAMLHQNNSLPSGAPKEDSLTLNVAPQNSHFGDAIPNVSLQSCVPPTLVNQQMELDDDKQPEAKSIPTINASEQQVFESFVQTERETNVNELNNDHVSQDMLFLTIKQTWNLYLLLSADHQESLLQSLSHTQKDLFKRYQEQLCLVSADVEMVTDVETKAANDNTGNSILAADYNSTQLSNEQNELIYDIKRFQPDIVLNALPFVLENNTLFQPKTVTLAELLSNQSIAHSEGYDFDMRMDIVLQWIRIASALEKADFWSSWKKMFVQIDKVTGKLTLQLDILDVYVATGVPQDVINKKELVDQLKKILNVDNRNVPEQTYAFDRIQENLDHALLEFIFAHHKILNFFSTFRQCFAGLNVDEQISLETDLTAAIDNKKFDWIPKGSACYRFCQGMQVQVDQFDSKKTIDMVLFLGQILEWSSNENFSGVVKSVCGTAAGSPTTLYRHVRDEVEPMVFIRFYRTLQNYNGFEACFDE